MANFFQWLHLNSIFRQLHIIYTIIGGTIYDQTAAPDPEA
jgi:hypothetical protein